ncbi:MAG: hypothetical protein FWG43_04890 [Clostridiales bacterium]|nr:hypothetical protein [Clostridiales bacterium]
MIRTEAVQLTSINGIGYKQKLVAGGAGITIVTSEGKAVFTVNKRDGLCVPYGQVDEKVFTATVTEEVLNLTRGLPYKKLDIASKVSSDDSPIKHTAEVEMEVKEDDKDAIEVVESIEYKEFIAQYTDKADKFSYQLMNKDLIQFAAKSTIVGKMIVEKTEIETIIRYIIRSKAANLAGNNGMEDNLLTAFIETFDSMNTRSAFKELNAYLRGELSKGKR